MHVGLSDALLWFLIVLTALGEAAIRYFSRSRLERLLDRPEARDRYERYLSRYREILIIAVALHALFFTWLTVRIAATLAPAGYKEWLIMVWVVAVVIVGAELPGRILGRRWSPVVLLLLLPPLYYISWPLRPLRFLPAKLTDNEARESEDRMIDAAQEEIRVAIEDAATEGAIEETEKEMIEGILQFRDADVSEIMTPRIDMECIEAELTLEQARPRLEKLYHSRIPVYEDNRDRVVGVLYLRDTLPWLGLPEASSKKLRELARPPLFVPETKRIRELLRDFQNTRVHLAVVLDEYGGVAGLVTIEDIIEEIFGEIKDEYDLQEVDHEIVVKEDGKADVDSRVRVSEVNETLDVNIPEEEDYDTIGGFLTARAGRIPGKGETFECYNLLFHVTDADERRIKRLQIELTDSFRSRRTADTREKENIEQRHD